MHKPMNIEIAAILAAVWGFVKGLIPAAFGAAIAVSMDKGATFFQKLIQFLAGIIVSYYVGEAIHEMTDFGPMVRQSISFTLGMIAYNSAKAFVTGASETAGEIPGDIWEFIKGKFGGGSK